MTKSKLKNAAQNAPMHVNGIYYFPIYFYHIRDFRQLMQPEQQGPPRHGIHQNVHFKRTMSAIDWWSKMLPWQRQTPISVEIFSLEIKWEHSWNLHLTTQTCSKM